jgi:hypothetical protein
MEKQPEKGRISIERGHTGKWYSITLTAPDGSRATTAIECTPENTGALEYFFERLKNGAAI